MAKRFTDTEKWKKPFIRSLSAEYKLFWVYLLDDCDFCGIWHPDFEVAQIKLGMQISEEKILKIFSGRIIPFDKNTKWFIPDFITFQYGEQLVTSNRMHKPIIDKLTKFGLLDLVGVDVVDIGTSKSAIRERVTKKVKDEILLRDGFVCQYCSGQFSREELSVDHINPINKGGGNDFENLATSCHRCNSYKSDILLSDFLERPLPFLKPTDFIKSKGSYNFLDAPFKKLNGIKEQDKDMDKEKEADKEQGGTGGIKTEGLIVPEMLQVFKDSNPEYLFDQRLDTEAAYELSVKVHKFEKLPGQATDFSNLERIKTRWGECVLHIKADSHYSTYSLTQINKYFQGILQSLTNKKNGTNKQNIVGGDGKGGGNGKLGTSAARIDTAKKW